MPEDFRMTFIFRSFGGNSYIYIYIYWRQAKICNIVIKIQPRTSIDLDDIPLYVILRLSLSLSLSQLFFTNTSTNISSLPFGVVVVIVYTHEPNAHRKLCIHKNDRFGNVTHIEKYIIEMQWVEKQYSNEKQIRKYNRDEDDRFNFMSFDDSIELRREWSAYILGWRHRSTIYSIRIAWQFCFLVDGLASSKVCINICSIIKLWALVREYEARRGVHKISSITSFTEMSAKK